MLSTDFIEYLQRMPIMVYNLSDGSQVIGRLMENQETAVIVRGLFLIQQYEDEEVDFDFNTILLKAVPHSEDECSIIYRNNIVFETVASLKLKKTYCDTVLLGLIDKLEEFEKTDDSSIEWISKRWNN